MWLFSTVGWFCIEHEPGAPFLTVKARKREELDWLKEEYAHELGPVEPTGDRDFAFQATLGREAMACAAADMIREIGYPVFADAAEKASGPGRGALVRELETRLSAQWGKD